MTIFLNLLLRPCTLSFLTMTSCLLKLKVTPSFCFTFKIPDNVTASNGYVLYFYIYYLRLLDFLLFCAQKNFFGLAG